MGLFLNSNESYKYDDNGNIIESILEDVLIRSKLKTNYKYKLDENNNWIEQIVYKNEIPKIICERKFEYY